MKLPLWLETLVHHFDCSLESPAAYILLSVGILISGIVIPRLEGSPEAWKSRIFKYALWFFLVLLLVRIIVDPKDYKPCLNFLIKLCLPCLVFIVPSVLRLKPILSADYHSSIIEKSVAQETPQAD